MMEAAGRLMRNDSDAFRVSRRVLLCTTAASRRGGEGRNLLARMGFSDGEPRLRTPG